MRSLTSLALLFLSASAIEARAGEQPPNIVLIFADDLGYGDLSCYGNRVIRTPNLDQMAKDGLRLTSFYVPQAVCSASRAALMTGCYPNRVGILGALGPQSKIGISDRETTIAQMLKTKGYATAIYGKWHLGFQPRFLPTRHGFDDYLGLPYSNDMWPRHPTAKFPPLPLYSGDELLELNPDQTQLTTRYTEKAVEFIARNKSKPFFLYVPHTMPHVPLHVSEKFRGKSKGGTYGDVIEELDWSVGRILAALKEYHLEERTLVMFTSDNGPWLSYGNHAGSAGPLREGKMTTFEGGVCEPFLARWPGKIKPGRVSDEPAMTIDILPTLAKLTGAALPANKIDGKDMSALLLEENGKSPHEALYFWWDRELQAVRSGQWKLHFPHSYRTLKDKPGADGKPGESVQAKIELSLFDLSQDIGEKVNVAQKHPEVVKRLQALAEEARKELGDTATKQTGSGVRQPGRIE
jgi:arylsulfatase A-like enzyme